MNGPARDPQGVKEEQIVLGILAASGRPMASESLRREASKHMLSGRISKALYCLRRRGLITVKRVESYQVRPVVYELAKPGQKAKRR